MKACTTTMHTRFIGSLAAAAIMLLGAATPLPAQETAGTLALIGKVNDHWQATHSPEVRAFWDDAAYFTGNMEAYRLTGKARYLEYAGRWARHNRWQGATGDDPARWRYKTYGEGQDFVLFGDWQVCFQTYIDLDAFAPAPHKTARAVEVMGYECASAATDYWWWADALYMVMPVMTKLYKATGDTRYLDKLYANFCFADSLMFDPAEGLYYRDGKYIYPTHRTEAGKKDFWARGDGWVLAGLAKVLADMPADYRHRPFFERRFKQLAAAVGRCQQPGGYWTRSMLDPAQAEGPETSGTAFFTYGLLWGMNHGLLDRTVFKPIADRAWRYLTETALQPDGSVGYVQPIGEKAVKGQRLTAADVTNFGTGAFLLAACERVRFDEASADGDRHFDVTVSNPRRDVADEVVSVKATDVFARLGISGGRQFRVTNSRGQEVPYQLTHDSLVLIGVNVQPGGTNRLTFRTGLPADFPATCYGRQYPERVDDIAWENDRTAYRLYGPALQRTGERAYGYDVWVKSTPEPVVERRYHSDIGAQRDIARLRKTDRAAAAALERRTSYHYDHGTGLDCYSVGPTLGCGAPALYVADSLRFPYCYERYTILDNGPLRFTVSLTYADAGLGGVTGHRTVSLDRGSNFCRTTVSYDGLSQPAALASGVVVHTAGTRQLSLGKDYVAYADPTDNASAQNGLIYVAALFPHDKVKTRHLRQPSAGRGIDGHAVGIKSGYDGRPFTYYFGSAWSHNDCRSFAEWESRCRSFIDGLSQPLVVTLPPR